MNINDNSQPDTTGTSEAIPDELLSRVGQLTRTLHDNLRELGYDQAIQNAAQEIPDVRDRLNYVVKMTDQAAQRVLNAIDLATPLQEKIAGGAAALGNNWKSLQGSAFDEDAYRKLAGLTVHYLDSVHSDSNATRQQLMEIMMAQDFQDLTGQVIRKVTEIAHNLEHQLVQLLLEYAPTEIKREKNSGLLNGPQINPEAHDDIVANQSQVDDLLGSLGF
jgi:chemotaxis protein CheZ